MKLTKVLALVFSLVMVFSFAACGADTANEQPTEAPTAAATETALPEIKHPEAGNVQFAKEFSIKVNGKEVTSADLKDAELTKITVETINSKGNAGEATYTGYAVAEVLKVAGVADAKTVRAVCSDGYESDTYDLTKNPEYLVVAVEKDKEMSEDGSLWFAPCTETTTGKYCSMVVEIVAE